MNRQKIKDPTLKSLQSQLGRELSVSDWVIISQERVNAFAECTEDRQWIHTDVEKAQKGPLRGTIAHGFLLLSLLPFFHRQNPFFEMNPKMIINYGLNRVRFINPVMTGVRIRNRAILKDAVRKGFRRILLTIENTLEIEGATKPAMVADLLVLILP